MTLVETMEVGFTVGTLARMAIVAYVGSTLANPFREWTIYAGVMNWGKHAFIYAESKSGERYRYDVGANEEDYAKSWKHPFTFYDGWVYVSNRRPDGAYVPVAKLSRFGKSLWDRMVVGNFDVYRGYQSELGYNFYVSNCYAWTARATATAVVVGLLPI